MGPGAWGARWFETTPPCPMRGILLLFADLFDQLVVGGAADDLVELGAVVGDQADPTDHDVARAPVVAPPEHAVLDGDLGALLRNDLRLHRGQVTLAGVAEEHDLLVA